MTAISKGSSSIGESAIWERAYIKSSINEIRSSFERLAISSPLRPTFANKLCLKTAVTESITFSTATPFSTKLAIEEIALLTSFSTKIPINSLSSKDFFLKRYSSTLSFSNLIFCETNCSKIFTASLKDPSDIFEIERSISLSIFNFSPLTTFASDLTVSSGLAL